MRKTCLLKFWLVLTLSFLIFLEGGLAFATSALFIDLARVKPGQKGWQAAWATGFGLSFPITPNSALFLNFNRWKFEISARDSRLLGGRLTLSPLSAGVYFLIFHRKALSPLFSLGTGYIFSQYHFNRQDNVITIPEIIKLTKEINGYFSWQAGAGLRLHLTRRAYLWFLVERYQSHLSIETTIIDLNLGTTRSKETFKFTPLLYRLGLQLNI